LSKFQSDKLVVIGVGLIGGSVASALRRAGGVRRIIGVGRSLQNMRRALELGVIDETAETAGAAVKGADAIVLAVPVRQNEAILAEIGREADGGALITDTGSTKGDFVEAAARLLPGRLATVVPGHPIAGAELTGVEAASADLFVGKNVVLTPFPETSESAAERTEALWLSCGARVHRMSPGHHDRVFAAVSHLPHVLAYALVHMISIRPDAEELFGFAAGGFRDFTRIAASSPEMWRDIALANREALLADIDAYAAQLARVAELVRAGDAAGLEAMLAAARNARQAWLSGKA
jgi:prephenate dehydrogenase